MWGQQNKYYTYFMLIGVFLIINILYNRYTDKIARESDMDDFSIIQKYLLTDHSLANEKRNRKGKEKKPILWIPIQYDYNSRSWLSFGSRSSNELNQPYLQLTVRSIINHCDDSFHICMIDDNSFSKLLPKWKVNMKKISSPVSDYMRQLGLAKIIHKYGGVIVPPSFLCMSDLITMYNVGSRDHRMFVGEMVNTNITVTTNEFYPNMSLMGARKESPIVEELIDFMTRTISNDYTADGAFQGEFNRWIESRVRKHQINLIEGKMLGTKTLEDEPVLLDNLMSNNYIDLYERPYGIYIPAAELLKRNKYEWFVRMSSKQVMESNTIISKYLLLAMTPESSGKAVKQEKEKEKEESNNWINYWQVPSGFGLWGQKPNYLGNNVLHSSDPNKYN